MQARPEVLAYVALGGNLGDAQVVVRRAMDQIAALAQTSMVAKSSLYLSAPVDSSGPDYVNAVVGISTTLTAPELLLHLQELENRAGRERPYFNAPRTLDLDLLLFGQASITSPCLTVPHPRMWQRAFVLVPLAEIAPDKVSAVALQTISGQAICRLAGQSGFAV